MPPLVRLIGFPLFLLEMLFCPEHAVNIDIKRPSDTSVIDILSLFTHVLFNTDVPLLF